MTKFSPLKLDISSHYNVSTSFSQSLMLAQLNDLDIMVGDVSNAYLHCKTKEKIYTVASPEFK